MPIVLFALALQASRWNEAAHAIFWLQVAVLWFYEWVGLAERNLGEEIPQASQSTSGLAKGPKLLSTLGLGRCVVLWLHRREKTRSGRVGVGA